jgi:catechol 2,3-dioxygenase-like lactoylglutathione lyase family enzyme
VIEQAVTASCDPVPVPELSTVTLIAGDADASIAFYRLLGLDLDDHGGGGEIVHEVVRGTKPADLDIDNATLATIYHDGFRTSGARFIIGFNVGSRAEVDDLYATITAAGHPGRQPPYDAFWGARYAIVADPDGNDVGIMSPPDDTMRSWPPTPSPSL